MNSKEKLAFEMYSSGKDISTIAKSVGLSRTTIHNYKKKYKWDTKVLFEVTDIDELEIKEKKFLATLIKSWESSFERLQELSDEECLGVLEKYTKLYYKLKSQKDNSSINQRNIKKQVAKDVIVKLSQFAIECDEKQVLEFISNNADKICDDILKSSCKCKKKAN
jgi:predicted transcriptional regulator